MTSPLVCVDVETSSFTPGRGFIVELGLAFVVDDEVIGHAGRLVCPDNPKRLYVPPFTNSVRIHGISASEIKAKGISSNEASAWAAGLIDRFEQKYGAFKTAAFNKKFETKWLSRSPWGWPPIDICAMERAKGQGIRGKQHEVAHALGIDPGHGHRAVDDAITCARIIIELNKRPPEDDTEVAGGDDSWEPILAEGRRAVAYAGAHEWRSVYDNYLAQLRSRRAPPEAERDLLASADGFTVRSGLKPGLERGLEE